MGQGLSQLGDKEADVLYVRLCPEADDVRTGEANHGVLIDRDPPTGEVVGAVNRLLEKALGKIFWVFILVLPLLWSSPAQGGDFMARGREYERRTLYGPALAEYERALKANPKNAEAYYRIGMISTQLGSKKRAAEAFRKALQANPQHTGARQALASHHLRRGMVLRNQRQWNKALKELEEAVRVDPQMSTAYVELGEVYERVGSHPEALKAYKDALKADPRSFAAHLHLGLLYNRLGKPSKAIQTLEAAQKLRSDSPELYLGLGTAYARKGFKDRAKAAFDQAIRFYLIAGRRDLALKVKEKVDTLLKPPSSP